jgi:serine phosphatase RsbU (regulator of sigma subunit)
MVIVCRARGHRCGSLGVLPLAAAILAVAATGVAAADQRPAEDPVVLSGELGERVQLIRGWRYHPGDDSAWAAPDLDDAAWAVVSSALPASQEPPGGWPGIGWFRRRLQLAEGMPATALAIRIEQNGASEVFLDGRSVARWGTVSASPQDERPVYPNDFVGIALEPGRTHVLAVRYSNSRDNSILKGTRGFGLNLRSVESAAAAYHRWARQVIQAPIAFAGAFAALALLHLLLFGFRPTAREHLFFALFAAATVAGLVLEIAIPQATDLVERLQLFRVNVAISVVTVLVGLVLVHLLFGRRPAWTTWLIAGGGAAVVAWVCTWQAFENFAPLEGYSVLAFLEMLRVSVTALLRREPDAWMVAVAFALQSVVTIVIGLSRIFGRFIESGLVGTASMVLVALAFSVFISRRAARTARELERRLAEVHALSARALEQERRAVREEGERRLLEAESRRRSAELEAARRLQLAMLPREAPDVPGFDLAFRMLTATEVGGDYVDLRITDGGRTLVAVGDATSHGLQAGMVVAVAKSLFQGVAADSSPAEVLGRIDAGLQAMHERHASMAMVVAAIAGDRLEIAAAAMPPVLVRRAATGAVEEILLPGVPLGSLANVRYQAQELRAAPGDVVLLVSDGVVEAVDAAGEPFGYERLATALGAVPGCTAEELVGGLVGAVAAFTGGRPLADDLTVVALVAR